MDYEDLGPAMSEVGLQSQIDALKHGSLDQQTHYWPASNPAPEQIRGMQVQIDEAKRQIRPAEPKPSAFGVGYEPGSMAYELGAKACRDFEARKLALDMALRVPGVNDAAIVKRAQAFYGFLRGSANG